jgi:predicted MFS family arabinose efflux permease
MLLIRPQPVEPVSREEGRESLLGNQRFLSFILVYFLVIFALYLPQPLAPNFLQNERGLSLSRIGQLYAISGLGIVVLNLALGRLQARSGFLLGQVAVGLFALLLWLGNGLPWFALAYFLVGGYRVVRSLATAQVRSLIHGSQMGLAYGMVETVSAVATILAPLLAGYAYTQKSDGVYILSVILIGLVVLVSLVSVRPAAPLAGAVPSQDSSFS